jgi:hypothetical protein
MHGNFKLSCHVAQRLVGLPMAPKNDAHIDGKLKQDTARNPKQQVEGCHRCGEVYVLRLNAGLTNINSGKIKVDRPRWRQPAFFRDNHAQFLDYGHSRSGGARRFARFLEHPVGESLMLKAFYSLTAWVPWSAWGMSVRWNRRA